MEKKSYNVTYWIKAQSGRGKGSFLYSFRKTKTVEAYKKSEAKKIIISMIHNKFMIRDYKIISIEEVKN